MNLSHRGPKYRVIDHLEAARTAAFAEIDTLRAHVAHLDAENTRLRLDWLESAYDAARARARAEALDAECAGLRARAAHLEGEIAFLIAPPT